MKTNLVSLGRLRDPPLNIFAETDLFFNTSNISKLHTGDMGAIYLAS